MGFRDERFQACFGEVRTRGCTGFFNSLQHPTLDITRSDRREDRALHDMETQANFSVSQGSRRESGTFPPPNIRFATGVPSAVRSRYGYAGYRRPTGLFIPGYLGYPLSKTLKCMTRSDRIQSLISGTRPHDSFLVSVVPISGTQNTHGARANIDRLKHPSTTSG